MALAAVATLAVSAVAAPAPAHAQRGVGAAIAGGMIGGAIVGGALAGPGYYGPGYGYYGPGYGYYGGGPAYVADPLWRLLLAASAFLGRLWLAHSQRAGLRLSPFTLRLNQHRHSRKRRVSGDAPINWPEKTVFSGH